MYVARVTWMESVGRENAAPARRGKRSSSERQGSEGERVRRFF